MTTLTLAPMTRTYRNNGMHCEQWLTYTLTGETRNHDHLRFDRGSDIDEMKISVKSARATLCSGNALTAETFDGQLTEFFTRVKSETFAFVSRAGIAYMMNPSEFYDFVQTFGKWTRDSQKNGGKYKIRLTDETRKMKEWFTARL